MCLYVFLDQFRLNFDLESLGYGAILTTEENPVWGSLKNLMAFIAERSRRLLVARMEWSMSTSQVQCPPFCGGH